MRSAGGGLDGTTRDSGLARYSVMGIVARAPKKVFRTPGLSRILGFQSLIKFAPDYIMVHIYDRNGRAVPRQGNLDGFLSRGIIRC